MVRVVRTLTDVLAEERCLRRALEAAWSEAPPGQLTQGVVVVVRTTDAVRRTVRRGLRFSDLTWLAALRDPRASDAAIRGLGVAGPARDASSAVGRREREGRALAGRALQPQAAPVVLDDVTTDRQTEAGATRRVGQRVAGLAERLEDPGLILGRDAHAGVDDADEHGVVVGLRTDGDRPGSA